jgi:hypothetical protein
LENPEWAWLFKVEPAILACADSLEGHLPVLGDVTPGDYLQEPEILCVSMPAPSFE